MTNDHNAKWTASAAQWRERAAASNVPNERAACEKLANEYEAMIEQLSRSTGDLMQPST